MLGSPEFWVALATLVVTVVAPIVVFVLTLSRQLTIATTQFTLVVQQQSGEITAIKHALEQMQAILATIAVDRQRVAGLEQRTDDRFKVLEQVLTSIQRDISDLRRGDGYIKTKT